MQTLLLLDLDGTLVDTPHYEAWRNAAHRFGAGEFTYAEYLKHVAGRPREDGAARLLRLKFGCTAYDPRIAAESRALAALKQNEFVRIAGFSQLFDDALRLLERIETARQNVAFYTASQNAPRLFAAALHRVGKKSVPHHIARQRNAETREALFLRLIGNFAPDCVRLVDDAPHAVDRACGLGIRAYQIRRHASGPAARDQRAAILPTLDALLVPISAPSRI